MRLRVGHQHSQLWPILARFVDYYSLFWVPGLHSTMDEPRASLRVGHKYSQFWPILARLMDYYSPFWSPEAISTVIEPQGALTCWSSTLAILADSGSFCGLLLLVLGSRSDFHD